MNGKRDIRTALLHERRAYLNEKRLEGSKLITENIIGCEAYRSCKTLMCFISTRIEVDTSGILEYAFADGKRVAAPRCVPETGGMDFYYIDSLDDLVLSTYNILEPLDYCELVTDYSSALCIVPGLAYNRMGYRIGFGKGYYDRFLSGYTGISCGVIFNDFLIDDIPTEQTDVAVDLIATETGIIKTAKT